MGSVLVGGARTPFGKLLGALAGLSAVELGAAAIRAALERSGVAPDQVDHVVLGQVLPAGCGQLPARQAAAAAGIPMSVPSTSVAKVCLSGTTAVATADLLIRSGECEVVLAGGMESMSRAPHLLPDGRTGTKYGSTTLLDHLAHDGLTDAFTGLAMGALTDARDVGPLAVGRADADAFAARSHTRALAATRSGRLAAEIVPVTVPGRRGAVVVEADEGVREGVTAASLAALPPAFSPEGTITAGSASPISDGAAVVVLASPEAAARLGLPVLAEVAGYATVAGPDSGLQQQPARAAAAVCARAGVDVGAVDLFEVNEAFAAVVLASTRALGLDADAVEQRVNVNGGAIALGHPIGASGARLVLTLAHELHRRGGGTGVVALCGGGGQGDAVLLTAPRAGGAGTGAG